MGPSSRGMAIQFRSSAISVSAYREDFGPTVTVLAAMSFPQTYTGVPIARRSPFRWPMV